MTALRLAIARATVAAAFARAALFAGPLAWREALAVAWLLVGA